MDFGRGQEAAEEHMAKALLSHKREQKRTVFDRNIRLRDYVRNEWQPRARDYQPATYRSYVANLEMHVLPVLGSEPVRGITRGDVKRFLDRKREDGWRKAGRRYEYSKDSLRLMNGALSVVLAEAVDDGLLEVNRCLTQGGRRHGSTQKTKVERLEAVKPFSWEECSVLLRECKSKRYGAFFELLL